MSELTLAGFVNMGFKIEDFQAKLERVRNKAVNKAGVHALNRTLSQLKTFTQKEINARLGTKLTRKDLNSKLFITKATPEHHVGKLTVRDRGTSLAKFSPKVEWVLSKKGWRKGVTVMTDGQRELVPGGFLVKGKSGKKLIFKRDGTSRTPISVMRSSQVFDLFRKSDIESKMRTFALETFRRNYQQDLKFYVGKELGGGT